VIPTPEQQRVFCSACPVQRGLCPDCATFWIVYGTKRYGIKPTTEQQFFDNSTNPLPLERRSNVVISNA